MTRGGAASAALAVCDPRDTPAPHYNRASIAVDEKQSYGGLLVWGMSC